MNTKILLSLSSLVMGAAGIAGSFLPHELLQAAGIPPAGVLPVLVQVLAGALLGFAMLNWMSRGSLMGGIYNRPVAIANLMHFLIGALALAKAAVIIPAIVYGLFAIGFGIVLFKSPVQPLDR